MNNKARIFEFLYKNLGDGYNINQISRLIGISVGSAFKILKEFEKYGYVVVNSKNNALLYQINMSDKAKELYEKLEEEGNRKSKKKTKIICTIGLGSNKPFTIKRLIENGMDVARIDTFNLHNKNVADIIHNIRQVSSDIPILLDIDAKTTRAWTRFALKNDLDFVSVPGNNTEEIYQINRILGYNNIKQVIGDKIKVIVKISRASLRNYKEIIGEAYGVIIDRNRLANNIEILPKLQKEIIKECNKYGKPVILSGNILNSMIIDRHPVQSEVYDISNAVLEGVSCLMLSEEVTTGKYPLEAVKAASAIIKSAEVFNTENIQNSNYDLTRFIGNAVSELERILRIDALLIITSGGYSARMISSRRLRCKTIATTSREKIFRQLHLLWGIEPLYVNINTEDISNNDKKVVILEALKKGFIGKRDQIAIIASIFHSKSKRTNFLEIHKVNEFLDYLDKISIKQSA